MSYQVFIDDNYRYQDSDSRVTGPTFQTYLEAVAYCQARVDSYLEEQSLAGVKPEALYSNYTSFGDDPFIVPDDEAGSKRFSAWDYARARTNDLVGKGNV